MKKTIALLLTVLLMISACAVPAFAAKKMTIITETLYAGTGEYRMNIENFDWSIGEIRVKSSKPSVLKVVDKGDIRLLPKKAGKAVITIDYEIDGNPYTLTGTYTVKNCPSAVKSVTVNGKAVKLKKQGLILYDYRTKGFGKTSVTVNLTPEKGWTISNVTAYYYTFSKPNKHINIKFKDNKAFTLKKDCEAAVIYTLKKGKSTFNYTVLVRRPGE